MDKILRINMGAEGGPAFAEGPLGDYAGLGGRAMTSGIVSKEVPPLCHPLGEDNKLVIAPGLLSGTAAAMSGRLSVSKRSLSNRAVGAAGDKDNDGSVVTMSPGCAEPAGRPK